MKLSPRVQRSATYIRYTITKFLSEDDPQKTEVFLDAEKKQNRRDDSGRRHNDNADEE